MLTTDALLESNSASAIVCLTCAQAKIPSMLAVDGHVTRAQVQYMSSSKQSIFFTLLLVTHAQAEAAQRLKEMVLEDAKRVDSCAPQLCADLRASARVFTHLHLWRLPLSRRPLIVFLMRNFRLVDSIEQDANAATGPLKGAFGN